MQTGDRIQSQLSSYAAALAYEQFDDDTVHAAKVRVIDTFGALVGGFAGDPCRIARDVAAQTPNPNGATIIGTALKTTPDLAAFANGTTARYVEMNDVYHWPGSSGGHPSDVLIPIFAGGGSDTRRTLDPPRRLPNVTPDFTPSVSRPVAADRRGGFEATAAAGRATG
jgi:2-methylcitrate dehydratase PrpD